MGCLLAALGVTASAAPRATWSLDELPVDGFAATVNERIITIGDVFMSIRETLERLRIMHGGADLREKTREAFLAGLERLIDQALILEEFKGQEIQIPERLIDERINEVVFERYDNDRASFFAALAEQQITLEEWRETIRDGLIIRIMRSREVGERIVVSPRQILEAYEARVDRYQEPERIRLRLIFMAPGDDPEATRTRLESGLARLDEATSFADLARELSEDPSATLGGDWGWIDPAQLRDELKTALGHLASGDISGIIETPEGFYVARVEERREASVKSFAEVRHEIESELRERQADRLYQDWVTRLRNKYAVIYHIPVPPLP